MRWLGPRVEVHVVAGGVLPGRNPPDRAEMVHESARTRVTRLFLREGTVIRKEPLGLDSDRGRHQRALPPSGLSRSCGAPAATGIAGRNDAGDSGSWQSQVRGYGLMKEMIR